MSGFAWSKWVHGLLTAGIGGGASAAYGALSAMIVDPKDINPQTAKFYYIAGLCFGFGALSHMLAYLKEHPAPDIVSEEKVSEKKLVTQLPPRESNGGTSEPMTKTVTTRVEEKVEISPTPPGKTDDK